MKAATVLLLALSAYLAGCSDDSSEPEPVLVAANGVTIQEVAIYQGLKRDLMLAGAVTEGGVPLIAGRDAIVRVFYATDAGYGGAPVIGRLEIDGAEPIDVTGKLSSAPSSDGDITSTVNFVVPGSLVGQTLTYKVSLLEESVAGSADNPAARWPSDGPQSVTVEGPANTLRVILAPVQYDFDGSGRLPDVSPAIVEQYRARLKQLFPVSDVEITVRAPIAWAEAIEPDGSGWDEIISRLVELRIEDGAPDDAYYYALFNPEDTLAEYCNQGCLLGATLLNAGPPDEGDIGLRLALGLGYPEYAVDTIAHELGHAHGRKHANCGSGLAPSSIDLAYPHEEGQIGVWGLDPATLQLYPPTVTSDIMGYCPFQWVSDYTYLGLFERGALVNLARWHEPTHRRRVALVSVTPEGAEWTKTTMISADLRGRRAVATIADATGARTPADGLYYAFDHLPGGLAFIPIGDGAIDSIELQIGGARHIVRAPSTQ